jgi:hypothetical protein
MRNPAQSEGSTRQSETRSVDNVHTLQTTSPDSLRLTEGPLSVFRNQLSVADLLRPSAERRQNESVVAEEPSVEEMISADPVIALHHQVTETSLGSARRP